MKYIFLLIILFTVNSYSQDLINQNQKNKLEIIKKKVKESIDAFAFDEDSNKRRYKVVFEGNYMRLLIMKRNGSAPINKGIVFDFATVYKFDPVSKRRGNVAYVNIWIASSTKKEGFKWKKRKLIMKVYSYENADEMMSLLKEYHDILVNSKKKA